MDKKTEIATIGSVEKWREIAFEGGVDEGVINCPLCQMFYFQKQAGFCINCPVALKTGKKVCTGTPYTEWEAHVRGAHGTLMFFKVQCPECKKLAVAEMEFLKSLLPSDDKCYACKGKGKIYTKRDEENYDVETCDDCKGEGHA